MPADISISTNNEPSILTKLKHHSDKKIGPRQSDILKVITIVVFICNFLDVCTYSNIILILSNLS